MQTCEATTASATSLSIFWIACSKIAKEMQGYQSKEQFYGPTNISLQLGYLERFESFSPTKLYFTIFVLKSLFLKLKQFRHSYTLRLRPRGLTDIMDMIKAGEYWNCISGKLPDSCGCLSLHLFLKILECLSCMKIFSAQWNRVDTACQPE